jgi:hypothetical protein
MTRLSERPQRAARSSMSGTPETFRPISCRRLGRLAAPVPSGNSHADADPAQCSVWPWQSRSRARMSREKERPRPGHVSGDDHASCPSAVKRTEGARRITKKGDTGRSTKSTGATSRARTPSMNVSRSLFTQFAQIPGSARSRRTRFKEDRR